MNHTLTVSEELFAQLQREAHSRGLDSVERLLEECHGGGMSRHEVVRRIDALRERLNIGNGIGPDSVELLREDRNR